MYVVENKYIKVSSCASASTSARDFLRYIAYWLKYYHLKIYTWQALYFMYPKMSIQKNREKISEHLFTLAIDFTEQMFYNNIHNIKLF